ncbi:cilia- and flagella-associated protein 46-like [Pseudoliparis swirei]|uniref:cilia- and flagella-associated protein 46-like n=1 Tax=Pseudoliparis swirei TaxID=2059687 RepID=UPI0024BE30F2|nr:cilia- and flagella-associated protein 46-like [Pseudoliparis swirei]
MLHHRLPSSALAAASLDMLECHGRSDPAASGQYLALFQVCASTPRRCLCALRMAHRHGRPPPARPGPRLGPHRTLLLSREERPGGTPTGAQDSLHGFSQAFSHLTIQPSHLNILAELPPNMKILLLQHSEDGSELYGAFYEVTRAPKQKGKTAQGTGSLACTRVAKVPVRPRALLALRGRTRAFGLEARLSLAERGSEERRGLPGDAAAEETLGRHFRDVVRDMDDYLNPLLTQFDFSCFRPQASSPPVPEMTKAKDKEEKGSSAKFPAEPGECVVLLADRKLLQLPLEALTVLQGGGLSSLSRDFSLQLLHSRLNREEPDKGSRGRWSRSQLT